MKIYSLYSSRKKNGVYPKKFVKVVVQRKTWFMVEGVLTVNEIERCDLVYHGHNMSHVMCMEEIERLGNQL